MTGPVVMVIIMLLMPFALIIWNRQRVKGKMLCYIVREDKSVISKLCQLREAFVLFENRAYDVYPDFVRLTRYPAGWPAFLQELVPCSLYDEEDAIPLDWIHLDNRLERSMELRAALDENWIRKLVQETSKEGAAFKINMKKVLPIALILIGGIGLVFLLMNK